MDFSNYSARDFLLNESFQKWVISPDEETRAFWNDWMIEHPHKAEVVEEAKTMIQRLRCAVEKDLSADADEVWARISKDIDN